LLLANFPISQNYSFESLELENHSEKNWEDENNCCGKFCLEGFNCMLCSAPIILNENFSISNQHHFKIHFQIIKENYELNLNSKIWQPPKIS